MGTAILHKVILKAAHNTAIFDKCGKEHGKQGGNSVEKAITGKKGQRPIKK